MGRTDGMGHLDFFYARAHARNINSAIILAAMGSIALCSQLVFASSSTSNLKHSHPDKRLAAVAELKNDQSPEAVAALNQAMISEKNPQVRLELLDAIGAAPEHANVSAIRAALSAEEAPLRKRAAYVLGRIGSADAESSLIEFLFQETDAGVKAMMLQSLSLCGSERSRAAIESARNDERPSVRAKANEALDHLNERRALQEKRAK